MHPHQKAHSECLRLRGELQNRFKRQRFNVLIFGKPGCGKSALVNTIQRAFGAPKGTAKVVAYLEHSSHTRIYEPHAVPGCNISLWDTYGWETNTYAGSNYTIDAFNRMLLGFVPQGFERGQSFNSFYDRREDRKIDAVILTIPAVIAMSLPDLQLLWNGDPKAARPASQPAGLRDMYLAAKKHGLPVVVAVTIIDEDDGPFGRQFNKHHADWNVVTKSNEWRNSIMRNIGRTLSELNNEFSAVVPWLSYTPTDSADPSYPLEEFALRGIHELAHAYLEPHGNSKDAGQGGAPEFYVWSRETKFAHEVITEARVRVAHDA